MCLEHRCSINTRLFFPTQMRSVITAENGIFQSSTSPGTCPQPGSCCLSCFCLGWSIQCCAENPLVSRSMATQVHCLASGSLHQPHSPTSSPCGDTPSWSHGPVTVMCPLSFGTHTYWHDVPTPVLGAGYWGATACVTWGGKHRG